MMSTEIVNWPDKYRKYSSEIGIDSCPNCSDRTRIQRHDQRIIWPVLTENLAPPLTPYVVEEVWRCVLCKRSMTQLLIYGESDTQRRNPVTTRLVYPVRPPRDLPSEAPMPVASLFREASICEFSGALRGSAGLYRSAVEAITDERGVRHGNLKTKIEKLGELGVEDDVINFLHEARVLGNWSLHDGIEFSQDEIGDVAQLITDAVEQIYVMPAHREAMRRARADRRNSVQSSESSRSTATSEPSGPEA